MHRVTVDLRGVTGERTRKAFSETATRLKGRSMTPTLAHPRVHRADGRARDWAEIQERMLVPLYEAVYERLGVGTDTRLLGVGCGSGLALLMAAARGAGVTGCDPDGHRLALARDRLLPAPQWGIPAPARGRT